MDYSEFLETKKIAHVPSGFDANDLHDKLFPFQKAIVKWSLKRGRSAIFADTGLGKTFMEVVFAHEVHKHTCGEIIIFAPLCVAHQTKQLAMDELGIDVNYCRSQSQVKPGINITNYEMLDSFDSSKFAGIVLDEASIIKSYDGKTTERILDFSRRIPYRLSCTATPSPNDFMELGNQAEFVGVMSREEMLAMFFIHDGGDTAKWRLKGHGEIRFWKWLSTWAVVVRKPSDLGFKDDGYDLPPLIMHEHIIATGSNTSDQLFAFPAQGLNEQRAAKRLSLNDRVDAVADLVNASNDPWMVWCHLNDESDALGMAISNSVTVQGSDSIDHKEFSVKWFISNEINDKINNFGDKLSCKKKHISRNIIEKTEKKELKNQQSIKKETLQEEKSICVNTQKTIEINSEELQNNKMNITEGEEKSTQTANQQELMLLKKQKNGQNQIQKLNSRKECESTELQQMIIDQCLNLKEEDALYVDCSAMEIKEEANSTSIIAMNQELSEDYCVQDAISELGNLKIQKIYYQEHQNILKNQKKVMISKPSIFGYGLNLQHCNNTVFAGIDNSFEAMYQAIRRFWRFGQKKPVNVHLFLSESEVSILENIKRKEAQHNEMSARMVDHMQEFMKQEIFGMTQEKSEYKRDVEKTENYELHLADCVDLASEIETGTIDYTIFSPPFASLYTYSNSDRDMGNSKDNEFYDHFKFLVDEMLRITRPGRLLSFHCMNLPTSKQNDGFIGIKDFRGELIRMFVDAGWIFHSEVVIWKDPVTAMQRTKALGLLHKTIRKDSSMSRQGIPDYLVTMRKPGINDKPVNHYRDEIECVENDGDKEKIFPVDLWQQYASPVWMDIRPNRTLQHRAAKDNQDERHICPLQLDVIERAMELWTRKDDLVFSPFSGIGSEGYVALRMGRKFIGSELKESYFELAKTNLQSAIFENKQTDLFE